MGAVVTPGWNLFQYFDRLDTTSQLNCTFSLRYTCGAPETNRVNTVGIQCY